ncbi:hypothetical protein I4U23_027150 [Adineta vaga]|nr:hypothetical protein I4U23_027150 [Adineta vaga]
MVTQWNPTIGHVFHSDGITSMLSRDYPAIYRLMQEELESTSAYLETVPKMKTIPLQLDLNQPNVQKDFKDCLGKYLPESAQEDIRTFIINKYNDALPSLASLPAGKSHMIIGRINGCDRSSQKLLFWSCGFDLNLSIDKSTKWPRKSENYLIYGDLKIVIFECNQHTINQMEKHALHNHEDAKRTIMDAYPRPPLLGFNRGPTVEIHQSAYPQISNSSQLSLGSNGSETTNEKMYLHPPLEHKRNYAVSILKIREFKDSSLSPDAINNSLQKIKSYIREKLLCEKTFIDKNEIIVEYSSSSAADVRRKLDEFCRSWTHGSSEPFMITIEHRD